MPVKVLVLSCNTGGGHNAAGRAILEGFLRRDVQCEMRDALSFASERVSKVVSDAYIRTVTVAPKLFGWCYRAGGAISSARRKSPVYLGNMMYARALGAYVEENRIDAVVMPHLFPAETLTHYKRRFGLRARTYLVSTDYVCCPFFEETEVDRFFIPHAALVPEFVRRGIPREKLTVTGIPVSARYARHTPKAEARERLALPERGNLLLVMTGSMGFGHVDRLVDAILPILEPEDHVAVLGGNNEILKKRLRETFAWDARVQVLDFTERVDLFMDAADLLFTKPGGLTTTEAAVKGIPLIHTHPIPGCETLNMEFFGELGMSVSADTPEGLARLAQDLLRRPEKRAAMIQRQRENVPANAADAICEFVLREAGEI